MANETLEQLGNALEAAQQKIGAVAEEVSEQAYNELVAIRREKLRGLQEAGNDPFELTSYPQADFAAEVKESFVDVPEGEQGRSVCMAGRMMSKRVMGKASFADLRDTTGNIQLYVRRDDVGVEEYQAFKKFDIGDIIGVRGFVFRTKMGEISVHVTEIVLLSKSLLPLPEKFHGLKDREARYRQRYVDLIVNPEVRKTFEVRSKFIRHMRNYLDERGYMEVETPVLNTIAGGAAARPFVTHHNTLDIDMYMRIATELPLKRLIVGGIDRVYEIGRIFRNEGMDPKHNPEFTTVELYQAYADFHTMMDIAEGILSSAALELLGGYEVEWLGEKIDLTPGWRRLTMVDAVKEYAGIDFGAISDNAQAVAAAEAIGVELPEAAEPTWGNALYACFDQRVEEKLIQPTFITMYPVEVSPLTKRSPQDKRLTERFELFICHSEMANAYSELNDPIDQRQRFEKQVEQRERGDDETEMLDLIAIAQSSPGAVAVNGAIVVGYKLCRIPGVFFSILGAIIPPFFIISIISGFYTLFQENEAVQALLSGMRSGVGAVIVSVVWDMGSGIVKQKKIAPILIMLCAFIANYYLKINIVLIILICIILAAAKAIITERRRSHK